MVLLYRILDLSAMNAYILYNQHQSKDVERGDFLKSLARLLVVPLIQRRVCNQHKIAKRAEVDHHSSLRNRYGYSR